ncbi:MAG: hypothetical protein IKC87_06665 [Clostridia bacterium]|nr:hypothetical protein [Clostridia bacterium]
MLKIKNLKPSGFALAFSVAFLLQYGIEHAAYLLRDAVMSGAIDMTAPALNAVSKIASYAVTSLEVLILAAAAFVAFTSFVDCGARVALMTGGIITLCRLCYLIPHYYMTLFSMGFDTGEALLYLVPLTVFLMAIYFGEIALAVLFAMLPSAKRSRLETGDTRSLITASYRDRDILDIGKPITASCALIALTSVAVPFISSLTDAIMLLVDRGPAFGLNDAFAIIFDFVFLLILFVLAHLLCFAVKKLLIGRDAQDNTDNEECCSVSEGEAAKADEAVGESPDGNIQASGIINDENNSKED